MAERFHLLQNLVEALEVFFTTHARDLRAVEQAHHPAEAAAPMAVAPPEPQTKAKALASERRERRRARHERVWAFHRQGWPGHLIGQHLGIGVTTVFRDLRSEVFPERQRRYDGGRSRVDPWQHIVREHWHAGRRQARWLFHTLQQHGYRGSYPTLARYLQRLRAAEETLPARPPRSVQSRPVLMVITKKVWTPRTAAWLVLRRVEKRSLEEQAWLTALRRFAPALALTEEFASLLRERAPERLDPWMQRAEHSAARPLGKFAKRLWADYDAVRAAVTLDWSSGQTEGQINRLKMIKRQMYGRASLDLLGRWFLLAA